MLALMAAAAVELARALWLTAARLLRGNRGQGVEAGGLRDVRRRCRSLARPLLRGGGARAQGDRESERRDGQGTPAHGAPRAASRGASGLCAAGSPIGGGSRCLMTVWQRPHSMFFPATWKSWMKGVSV